MLENFHSLNPPSIPCQHNTIMSVTNIETWRTSRCEVAGIKWCQLRHRWTKSDPTKVSTIFKSMRRLGKPYTTSWPGVWSSWRRVIMELWPLPLQMPSLKYDSLDSL